MRILTGIIVAALGITSMQSNARASDFWGKTSNSAAYNWSGCYIGGHAGGGWFQNEWAANVPGFQALSDVRSTGWLAGGQLGCDYQTGNLVFGIEGTFSTSDIKGRDLFSNLAAVSHTDQIGMATGRLGYAFDRALPYVKGGLAYAHNDRMALVPDPSNQASIQTNDRVYGWVVGGGIEVAFLTNWSWKIEYDHLDFGSNNYFFDVPGALVPALIDVKQHADIVLAGINYRFP